MALKNNSLLILLALAACLSCAAGAQGAASINGVLEASNATGSLGTFSEALGAAGLVDTLNNRGVLIFGNSSFAVFAPDDAAFANVSGLNLMENVTELRGVLNYHIVWSNDTIDLSENATLQTLQGDSVKVSMINGTMSINGARVLRTQKYDNGTIYVIDEVLMPKTSAIGIDVVQAANSLGLKKFVAALQATGLADRLNGQGVPNIGSVAEGPFTVFAPSDEAFGKLSAANMKAITGNLDDYRDLLSYQILANVSNTAAPESLKTIGGSSFAVDIKNGIAGGANVIASEKFDNGIVYEIDQVLIPLKLSLKLQM